MAKYTVQHISIHMESLKYLLIVYILWLEPEQNYTTEKKYWVIKVLFYHNSFKKVFFSRIEILWQGVLKEWIYNFL